MNEIRLKNFRCFREEQTVRLAPLTLLVGENSTGKTSFLAMIRALWDVAGYFRVPDFKEEPYDLGSFDEIAHHRGTIGGQADTFEAGFTTSMKIGDGTMPYNVDVTFAEKWSAPYLAKRRIDAVFAWIEERSETDSSRTIYVGTSRGEWKWKPSIDLSKRLDVDNYSIALLPYLYMAEISNINTVEDDRFIPISGSPDFGLKDSIVINILLVRDPPYERQRLFASAPVRSKPRRTYDPSRTTPDPEGDYVPMYLANLYFQDREAWVSLKKRLEDFGKAAGLFDEISIRPLGKRNSEPFQVQIRKFGSRLKGPRRNLIDVGYGVSQALPVVIELLRQDAPDMFLLQQPEVHLHPSAQAALGSLFCQVAGAGRQLVVETHSDHLMDRVRMDVRDGVSALKPEDVSILFFERKDLDVDIHSIRIDEEGNILNAPEGYRAFFMEETARSLWKR